jgi:polar amino acid transport system ATP-binding protein
MSAAATQTMIEVSDLWKAFGPLQVLKGISLEVPKGTAMALIGPSGSGKSTLLRCINLLELPERGRVRVGDQAIDCAGAKLPGDRQLAAFPRAHGHGVPAVQPVPAHDRAPERRGGPLVREKMPSGEAKDMRWHCSPRSAWRTRPTPIPRTSRAVSSNVSPSLARSP